MRSKRIKRYALDFFCQFFFSAHIILFITHAETYIYLILFSGKRTPGKPFRGSSLYQTSPYIAADEKKKDDVVCIREYTVCFTTPVTGHFYIILQHARNVDTKLLLTFCFEYFSEILSLWSITLLGCTVKNRNR